MCVRCAVASLRATEHSRAESLCNERITEERQESVRESREFLLNTMEGLELVRI